MEDKKFQSISATALYKLVDKNSVEETYQYIISQKISLKQSTKFSVIIEREPFPPKDFLRKLAYIKGFEIEESGLNGGDANKPFEKLGYTVINNKDFPSINISIFQPQIRKYQDAIDNTDWLKVNEIYKFKFVKWIEENIDFENETNKEIKHKIEQSQQITYSPDSNIKGVNFIQTIIRYQDEYVTIEDIEKIKKIINKELPENKENLTLSFSSFPKTSAFLSFFAPTKYIAYDAESIPAYEFLSKGVRNSVPPKRDFIAFQFYQIFYQNIKKLLKESQINTLVFKKLLNIEKLSELQWNFITQDFLLYITRKVMNTNEIPAYYCVGFHFYDENPTNQLPRFIKNKIWENGYNDKFVNVVNEVPIGSLIAAKTTYTMNEDDKTISILEVHCIGEVTRNSKDGKHLDVDWQKDFKPFILKRKGGYRNTISKVNNQTNIDAIFYRKNDLDIVIYDSSEKVINETQCNLNQILFGAPGTGKTYNTKKLAVEIITSEYFSDSEEDRELILERYNELEKANQIHFTTFHQSMSYEDFIEGIKPESIDSNVIYDVKDGIFKKMSKLASREVYNLKNIENTVDELLFDDAWNALIEESQNSIENDNYLTLKTITNKDIEIVALSNQGNLIVKPKVEKALEYTISYFRTKKLFESFQVFNSIKNIDKDFRTIIGGSNSTAYWAVLNYIHNFLKDKTHSSEKKENEPIKKYVLIIDEINRGNVSSIFGELITLIEEDKRKGNKEEIEVTLPYSQEKFSVPNNLYIIGTMNTADRSVEALDTALRRRFSFVEMQPKPEVLIDLDFNKEVDLVQLLKTLNQRIELLIDKDHQIGHSYFINIKNIQDLKFTFKDKIIPLLEEYFYGDFGKIGLVLGNNFIEVINKNPSDNKKLLADFSSYDDIDFISDKKIYRIKEIDNLQESDFISIYIKSTNE